ncbi:MAG: S41 family peptidase [Planctomycetota bacterium]
MSRSLLACLVLALATVLAAQAPGDPVPIRLVDDPALSPDGSLLAFSWRGEVWIADAAGGAARRLTQHPADDREPVFSPDGREVAFVSDRSGSRQIWVVATAGGRPERRTRHTEGYSLAAWPRGGRDVLVSVRRDHFWRREQRIALRDLSNPDRAERILFDGYGDRPALHPDGRRLLYTREGTQTWRKGYRGSQEAQLWLFDRASGEHRLLHEGEGGCRSPQWVGESDAYVYCSASSGTFNLVRVDGLGGERRALTSFEGDGVHFPTVSADGRTVVFRRLFDLYRMDLAEGRPRRIDLYLASDDDTPRTLRPTLEAAEDVAFSPDGREIAFTAAGDLWVMDTILREPVRVTDTAEEERGPLFLDDGTLLVVADRDGRSDVWRVRRGEATLPFWRNATFAMERLTDDADVESGLRRVPSLPDRFSYDRGRGDVVLAAVDGSESRAILTGWSRPDYAISPDGRWLAWSVSDDDFNSDVWIAPLDGSREPFNLSCHPDNDANPVWSADGKILAFGGRRWGDEWDIVWVHLARDESEKDERDRRLEKALEKMAERDKKKGEKKKDGDKPEAPKKADGEEKNGEAPAEDAAKSAAPGKDAKKGVEVRIDFEGIRDRLNRIRIPNSFERIAGFGPKDAELLFSATVDGKRGLYRYELPEGKRPELVTTTILWNQDLLADGKTLAGAASGVPTTIALKGGKTESYRFRADTEIDLGARSAAIFDQGWRAMRDGFYDERLGNKDWDAVRLKYRPMAASCLDARELAEVGNMMLGELNGSHLGFSVSPFVPRPRDEQWRERTGHLGLRFFAEHPGPGWLVTDVIRGGPAAAARSTVAVGEIVLAVDGREVTPDTDPASVLTGDPDREVALRIRGDGGVEREVRLRPTSYGAAKDLLYEEWIRANRARVAELSDGTLGYLHIRAMSGFSLERFDAELYRVGHGKRGLVIDVRENGGGSIADHLLTCLSQPRHAITRPRDGGEGYPQDRRIYATWTKPIVVLCNQNSFSNAEIFSHAVKTLGRGKLVGVPTAGGVISTGSASLMGGLGRVRMPFRGWYLLDGQDMELNGAVPDVVIWPRPGEWPSGEDRQLARAVEVLRADCDAEEARPKPALIKSSER